MDSHVQHQWDQVESGLPTVEATGFEACASAILDDVRRAMENNRPEGARLAALRLVSLFTGPEPDWARGGLAPWQRRKIDRYLRDHLARPVQLDELAGQVTLSVSHFCRAFKESFGDTPHAHIIRLRLELAQDLMLTTSEPLSQVALASGFADQAHLSKAFRRIVGETPSAWRRRNLTDAQGEARRHGRGLGFPGSEGDLCHG
jgi:AraC family transcriptional regulator